MHIEKMKLSDLKAADYNPRIELRDGMTEYEKLKKSLLKFGLVDPPIFNKRTGNLVGGHQRLYVAKKLNILSENDEVETSIVDLPLDKEKALNLALNNISGRWDEEKLTELLNEITEDNLELTGFDSEELENLIESTDIPNFEPGSIDDQGDLTKLEPKFVKCPCCGEEFDLRDVES